MEQSDNSEELRPVCESIGPEPQISSDVMMRDLLAENRKLRFLLACRVGGPLMYCDDGELQDNSEQPFIDFKRDSVDDIQEKLKTRFVSELNPRTEAVTEDEHVCDRIARYSYAMGWMTPVSLDQILSSHKALYEYRRRSDEEVKADLDKYRENVRRQVREEVLDGEYIAASKLQHMTLSDLVAHLVDQGIDAPRIPRDVVIDYTNWKDVRNYRRIRIQRVHYGATEYHPDPQWLMDARDLDKCEDRTFAIKDIHNWNGPINDLLSFFTL